MKCSYSPTNRRSFRPRTNSFSLSCTPVKSPNPRTPFLTKRRLGNRDSFPAHRPVRHSRGGDGGSLGEVGSSSSSTKQEKVARLRRWAFGVQCSTLLPVHVTRQIKTSHRPPSAVPQSGTKEGHRHPQQRQILHGLKIKPSCKSCSSCQKKISRPRFPS
jgi:hypothetical protein